jgi:hypothetical protein
MAHLAWNNNHSLISNATNSVLEIYITILLMVKINRTLSKAIQNLVMKMNKSRSFKWPLCDRQHICPEFQQKISISMSTNCAPLRFVSSHTSIKGFSRLKIEQKFPNSLFPPPALYIVFCYWTIHDSMSISISSIQISLKHRILLKLTSLLLTSSFSPYRDIVVVIVYGSRIYN